MFGKVTVEMKVSSRLKDVTIRPLALDRGPAVLRGASPTSDPVRVGHIGAGTRGWDLIKYNGASEAANGDRIATSDR